MVDTNGKEALVRVQKHFTIGKNTKRKTMELLNQSHKILRYTGLKEIEIAGRTCYKSEDKITEDSAEKFVKMLIKRGHDAMLEHGSATVKLVTNRGISHEIVRHRVASYGQESTRYVKYDNIAFINPPWFSKRSEIELLWENHMKRTEELYTNLIDLGYKPEEARGILPNDLKTELVVTANYREWRHIFNLRVLGTTGRPHPQIKELFTPVLKELHEKVPGMFDDIWERYQTLEAENA